MRLGKYLSSLTKPELELISENANFTTDEKIIFLMLAKNKSIVQISQEINVCTRTVNRKIVTIKRGFTLAEILITLGIIGIVAAMTLPALNTSIRRKTASARLKTFYSRMKQIQSHRQRM